MPGSRAHAFYFCMGGSVYDTRQRGGEACVLCSDGRISWFMVVDVVKIVKGCNLFFKILFLKMLFFAIACMHMVTVAPKYPATISLKLLWLKVITIN